MTLLQRINYLRKERYQDLTPWEKSFIDEIYGGVEGLPVETIDEDLGEYLTRRQIEKIQEIWSDLGL